MWQSNYDMMMMMMMDFYNVLFLQLFGRTLYNGIFYVMDFYGGDDLWIVFAVD